MKIVNKNWALSLSLGALVLVATSPLCAATIEVTNLNDAGPGSLRQAILDANATPNEADIISIKVTGNIKLSTGVLA
ncbi:MAG: hypothetical protein RLZZ502_796, partial [Pseudomonadota bacterium]